MKNILDFHGLMHGGDYNPEQWLEYPDILKEDIELMKKAKINAVSMGMFSWVSLEPEEGVFQFQWLEEAIDRLYENGISTILATPSGARPHWMSVKYPQVLRVDESRHLNLFGGRHNHCYTSPIYREKVETINTELAKRFAHHPAVVMWHISNEYGGECHCPLCQEAFRRWIKEKYQTIEEVNKRWCTTFWSHTYQNFDQIESPSPRGENALHALKLDWKRFVTAQTVDFAAHEIAVVKKFNQKLPTTVNMMYYFEGLDYHKFKDIVDIISWDTYPTWNKFSNAEVATDNAMFHDVMRTLKQQPFLLMESCPSSTNWQGVSKLKKPDVHELSSLQAVAHGSDSVLYFQIRQSRGSSEKFHGAVIDHYGKEDARVFKEVSQVGESLTKLFEIQGSQTVSEVAVLYDWENRWALEEAQGPRNDGLYYKEAVQKSYKGFRSQGINVDMIDESYELNQYKIIAAPMVYLFKNGFADKVREFIKQGGQFIMTYWSGIVDETDRCFLGGTPYDLMDVFGMRSTEIDGLYDWESNEFIPVSENSLGLSKRYSCKNLCNLVQVDQAEVLMNYGLDFYKGTPAVTANTYGNGKAYFVCADVEQEFYDDVYAKIVKETKVERVFNTKIPYGIEITVRQLDATKFIFVQNFLEVEVEFEILPGIGEILYGNYNGWIGAYKTIVIRG